MTAAEKLLGRADRYLVSAAALLELGDHESAVSRAYYAMFYTARAVLGVRGVTAKTHSGVVSEFGRQPSAATAASIRSIAFISTSIPVAYEIRTPRASPKASPGTSATPASSSR